MVRLALSTSNFFLLNYYNLKIIILITIISNYKFKMAYNPVARGGVAGPSGAATGAQGNDQFSMQNTSPEDYLGNPKTRNINQY
jgi:hypothetical protein